MERAGSLRVALGGASLRGRPLNPNINRFGEGAGVAYLEFGTLGKEVYKVNTVCNMTGEAWWK